MRKRRQIEVFSISFLDLLSGALGAVIILYVAIPKNQPKADKPDVVSSMVQAELASAKEKNQKLEDELKALKDKMATTPVPADPVDPVPMGSNFDIGFKFKGKNVVFIIDTSYSMVEEDRMGQVKAGLKMLITSLPTTYKIDVIQYPLGERAPFKSLWGDLKETTQFNKTDAFDFIYNMRPLGGTPTRDALLFVLRNYNTTTDIVLLTDGAPTLHNSNQKDDIYDILKNVRDENPLKIQINVIGVGEDFIRDKTSERYKFLNLLSEQNNGFFVGF
jgi:hypothetical protein